MTQLTHEQHLWINLLLVIAAMFAIFAVGGYVIDKQEAKERRQQDRYNRRRRNLKSYNQQQDINKVYASLGKSVWGMDKFNAICNTCQFNNDGKCYCPDKPDTFVDDTAALVDCNCYTKRVNTFEQNSGAYQEYSLCRRCQWCNWNSGHCTTIPATIADSKGAILKCSNFIQKECEKGKKK